MMAAESRRFSGPRLCVALTALATTGAVTAACGVDATGGTPQPAAPVEVSTRIQSAPCRVSAFAEADHAIANSDILNLRANPVSCVDALIQRVARDTNVLIVLIGHVDKRELRRPKARVYGNSMSLGYQRALAVRSALLDKYEAAVSRDPQKSRQALEAQIVVIAAGASSIGERVETVALEEDRAVEIRPYWFVASVAPLQPSPGAGSDPGSALAWRSFSTGDKLTLLTLIVALSAYLASVRLVLFGRRIDLRGKLSKDILGNDTPETAIVRKRISNTNLYLIVMTFADAPMIISGLLLGFHIFYRLPNWSLDVSIGFFTLAAVVLVMLHAFAWKEAFESK